MRYTNETKIKLEHAITQIHKNHARFYRQNQT